MLKILVTVSVILSTSVWCQNTDDADYYKQAEQLLNIEGVCEGIQVSSSVSAECKEQFLEVCSNPQLLFQCKFLSDVKLLM